MSDSHSDSFEHYHGLTSWFKLARWGLFQEILVKGKTHFHKTQNLGASLLSSFLSHD